MARAWHGIEIKMLSTQTTPAFVSSRRRMIEMQLRARGVTDRRVIAAVAAVPRELFVSRDLVAHAYTDAPLPTRAGQMISEPSLVALMAEALDLAPVDRVLEIGTGSGYAAAVLSMLAAEVYTIERIPELADEAREHLEALRYTHVAVRCGDGLRGWPEHAPFDAIVLTASARAIPTELITQLAIGGRLVMPLAGDDGIMLVRITRLDALRFQSTDLGPVRAITPIEEDAGRLDDVGLRQAG